MPKPTAEWFIGPTEKAKYVRVRLDRWEKLYAVRQNPKFAWLAYNLAREAGIDIPDWILKYLDSAGWNLTSLWNVKKGEIDRGVLEALGFVIGGTRVTLEKNLFPESNAATQEKTGRFNPFGETTEERQLRLSENVEIFQKAGMTFKAAKKETATTRSVSVRTVELALKVFPIYKTRET